MVKMRGGSKPSVLSPDIINNGVKDIGSNFVHLPGSGNPRQAAAEQRSDIINKQNSINNLNGGGKFKGGSGNKVSIIVPCPKAAGASPAQQASSCELAGTAANIKIQTALFNQIGGKRKKTRKHKNVRHKKTRGKPQKKSRRKPLKKSRGKLQKKSRRKNKK
tara:strand:- start:56 stop:541 length:486 start_codon:yes stop_codon:yes gene_type:complete